MAKTIRRYVDGLSDDSVLEMLDSYEKFERDGVIGEEPIRLHAQAYLSEFKINDDHIVMWMKELAFEGYRRLANAQRAASKVAS